VFNSDVRDRHRRRREQYNWWLQCYSHRDQEYQKFVREFLYDDQISTCCATGQYGAGKTTFILAALEHPIHRRADGIWIDIGLYESPLRSELKYAYETYDLKVKPGELPVITREDWINQSISALLDNIISKTIERRFRQHFWWIYKQLPLKYHCTDVSLQLDINCIEPTRSEYSVAAAEVYRDLAAGLISINADEDSAKIREQAFALAGVTLQTPKTEQLQAIRAYLRKINYEYQSIQGFDVEHLRKIDFNSVKSGTFDNDRDSAQRLSRWLRAYSDFFDHQHPLILVIDNIDWVYSPILHGIIVDYARRLARELHRPRLAGDAFELDTVSRPTEIKVVFTIRDWNMRNPRPGYDPKKEKPFSLSQEGYGYRHASDRAVHMPLDWQRLENVTNLRLQTIRRECETCKTLIAEKGMGEASVEGPIPKDPVTFPCDLRSLGAPPEDQLTYSEALQYIDNCHRRLDGFETAARRVLTLVEHNEPADKLVNLAEGPAGNLEPINREHTSFVEEISNGSIVHALSMCSDVSLKLIDAAYERQTPLDTFLMDYRLTIRAQTLNWVFESAEKGDGFLNFIREARNMVEDGEKRDYFCCAHRTILTYLYREDELGKIRTNVKDLLCHIEKYTLLPREQGRKALLYLFQPGCTQAEYITIYQDRQIVTAADITDEAEIHINPKGRAFISRIMLRLEYWARLADVPEPHTNLYECTPEKATRFLEKISAAIDSLSVAHKRNWCLLANAYKEKFKITDHDVPFEIYWNAHLTIGEAFYLTRVASSIMHAVILYFRAIFRDDNVSLFLLPHEQEQFNHDWPLPDFDIPRMQDTARLAGEQDNPEKPRSPGLVELYTKQLQNKQQIVIMNRLLNVAVKLDKIRREWIELPSFTLSQINNQLR
jgi:hypothetical protein